MKRRNELYDIGSWYKWALTADGGGAEEGLHDGRVHVDAKIFLLNQACVPSLDSLLDPLSKDIINGGVDDIIFLLELEMWVWWLNTAETKPNSTMEEMNRERGRGSM